MVQRSSSVNEIRRDLSNTAANEDLSDDGVDDSLDLDELLPLIGEFGRYQKLLLWLICLPACIPCGFCAFNQLFMTDSPADFWCAIPELGNLSVDQRKQIGIPFEEDGTYNKCFRYKINYTEFLELHCNEVEECSFSADDQLSNWPLERCPSGWEYNSTSGDTDEGKSSSIVVEFDLVCDRDIFPTLGLVALNTGGPVGVYLFGLLNDRAGRRTSYFTCLATLLAGSFLTAFSTGFWTWAFSRVIVGLTIPAVYQIPFIIALELVGPNYRSFVTVMTCTFYTFGLMMLAGITYFIRDWRLLSLVTSVPFLLYFLYILVMPESPRWLLAEDRLEEALKILETMARINGKPFPGDFREKLQHRVQRTKNRARKVDRVGMTDLCKTPNMRLKTLLITLNWFANETVYLGLSYYGPSLGKNECLSFFLSSLVEIPSYLLCWLVMDRWGRRWPLCLLMIFGGFSCVVTVLLPEDAVDATLVLFLVSKSMISASFLIIYPFAGELYPTQVRGVGIGTSSYIGGIGLICIPFITYLGKDNLRMPLVIMGFVAVFGGITGLRLPETLHHKLPQTLEEGEEFGKDWAWDDCLRCVPLNPEKSHTYGNLRHNNSSASQVEMTERIQLSDEEDEGGEMNERDALPPMRMSSTERNRKSRQSMRRLVRQASVLNTQRSGNGAMQLTYWF